MDRPDAAAISTTRMPWACRMRRRGVTLIPRLRLCGFSARWHCGSRPGPRRWRGHAGRDPVPVSSIGRSDHPRWPTRRWPVDVSNLRDFSEIHDLPGSEHGPHRPGADPGAEGPCGTGRGRPCAGFGFMGSSSGWCATVLAKTRPQRLGKQGFYTGTGRRLERGRIGPWGRARCSRVPPSAAICMAIDATSRYCFLLKAFPKP